MISQKAIVIDSLTAQIQFMESARARHLTWADRTNDPEIARAHVESARFLQQTLSQYKHLLDMYNKATE
jgi:hypothetical protein